MSGSTYYYWLYDLILESEEPLALTAVTGTSTAEDGGECERPVWRFRRREVPSSDGELVHDVLDFDRRRRLKVWVEGEDRILFTHGDTRVEWCTGSRTIGYQTGPDSDVRPAIVLERMAAPIAFILERPDLVALHASAVGDAEGFAYIFIGNSGAGKSTTALELMRRGYELLSDDLVLVDVARMELIAATPSLRLFDRPEAIPEAVAEELVMPGVEKYWYQLPDRTTKGITRRLAGVFSLEPDQKAEIAGADQVRGREATTRLLAQSFDLTAGAPQWRARRFKTICGLARALPVFAVSYGHHDRSEPSQLRAIEPLLSGEDL